MDGRPNVECVDEVCNVVSQGRNSGRPWSSGKSGFPMSALRMDKDVVPTLNEEWNDIIPHRKVGHQAVGKNDPWSGG